MSFGGKIVMDIKSLRAGARTCRTVANEVDRIAGRIKAAPHPEGMPGGAAAELASIGAALGRSSRALDSQARWLDYRATAGLFADGPFGGMIELTGPPLESPWEIPAPPPKKKEKEKPGPWWKEFGKGVGGGLKDLGEGVVRTGATLGAHAFDQMVMPVRPPGMARPSDHIPWVGKTRREFDEGMAWAADNPGEFLEAFGKDLIAHKEHSEGNHWKGAGKNTVEIVGLLFSPSKVAKAGKANQLAKAADNAADAAKGPREAAQAAERSARGRRNALQGPVRRRAGESDASLLARQATRHQRRIEAQRAWDRAKQNAKEASDRLSQLEAEQASRATAAADALKQAKDNWRSPPYDTVNTATNEAFEAQREEERSGR